MNGGTTLVPVWCSVELPSGNGGEMSRFVLGGACGVFNSLWEGLRGVLNRCA